MEVSLACSWLSHIPGQRAGRFAALIKPEPRWFAKRNVAWSARSPLVTDLEQLDSRATLRRQRPPAVVPHPTRTYDNAHEKLADLAVSETISAALSSCPWRVRRRGGMKRRAAGAFAVAWRRAIFRAVDPAPTAATVRMKGTPRSTPRLGPIFT